jgi:hypothetical protein
VLKSTRWLPGSGDRATRCEAGIVEHGSACVPDVASNDAEISNPLTIAF